MKYYSIVEYITLYMYIYIYTTVGAWRLKYSPQASASKP